MGMLWAQLDIEHRSGMQNAYRPVTDKDVLHLINSVMLEQNGHAFTYAQVHAIFTLIFVQNTSRRFMETLSVTVPEMELEVTPTEDGSILRSIKFKYAYDKRLGFCINEESVGEAREVQCCPVLWTLLLLQKLGVIESALEAWDQGTLVGMMRSDNYVTTKDLVTLLKNSHTTVNKMYQVRIDSKLGMKGEERLPETPWDDVMKTNNSSPTPFLHHWLAVSPHTRETISKVISYSNASMSLALFV
jgi:hypothetical protein